MVSKFKDAEDKWRGRHTAVGNARCPPTDPPPPTYLPREEGKPRYLAPVRPHPEVKTGCLRPGSFRLPLSAGTSTLALRVLFLPWLRGRDLSPPFFLLHP